MSLLPWNEVQTVNTVNANFQETPQITQLSDGSIVVVWVDFGPGFIQDVKFQRFDALGNALGSETLAHGVSAANQSECGVTALTTGGYVITYVEGSTVLGQKFTANGSPDGGVIVLSNPALSSTGQDSPPVVKALPNGEFVVVYSGFNVVNSTSSFDLVARVVSATGIPQPAFYIAQSANAEQTDPSVTVSSTSIAVSWSTNENSLTDPDIAFRTFSFAGVPLSGEVIATDAALRPNLQRYSSLTALSNGNFLVTWAEYDISLGIGFFIKGQILSPTGVRLGNEFIASSNLAGSSEFSKVTPLSDGKFLVIYETDLSPINSVQAKIFNADGSNIGGELFLSGSARGALTGGSIPEVVTLVDGRVAAVWSDNNSDGSETGIVMQILDPREGVFNATANADKLYGNDAGHDYFHGNAGADTIYGLRGNDTLFGDAGLDVLYGGLGDDVLRGGADRDLLYGERGDDELSGDAGNDYLGGGDGNDRLLGGIGDDSMYGEADADVMIGGLGQDYLDGGSGFDFASYETAAQGIRVDMVFRSGNTFDAIGDTFVNIEGLTGSNSADILTSTYGDDTVNGGGGADYINARSGNDTLFGGAGYDQIYAGDGVDFLEGGLDNDYLDGGNGIDTVSYANAGTNVTVDFITIASNTGEAAGDVFYQVENLLGSVFSDDLRGDNTDNVITGGDGSDILTARGGADTLLGGNGVDNLFGGAGIDILEGGADNDIMDGGTEFDTFRYTAPSFGQDTINLFQDGIDKFSLSAAGYSFSSFTITQSGANTLMTLTSSPSQTITLTNFTAANITALDFI